MNENYFSVLQLICSSCQIYIFQGRRVTSPLSSNGSTVYRLKVLIYSSKWFFVLPLSTYLSEYICRSVSIISILIRDSFLLFFSTFCVRTYAPFYVIYLRHYVFLLSSSYRLQFIVCIIFSCIYFFSRISVIHLQLLPS